MAKGSTHKSSSIVKVLYGGDSGSGKTGSLFSLLEAGYELRFLDLDNGLGYLINKVNIERPDLIDKIDYITVRDELKADKRQGVKVSGNDRAYVTALKYLEQWDDGSNPAEWGDKVILVVDSLSLLSRAAFRWSEGITPVGRSGEKNGQAIYGTAQNSLQSVLDMLTSEAFNTNVIVCAHIDYREQEDGSVKGFMKTVGRALGPSVPDTFNTMVIARTNRRGKNIKREISLVPADNVDVKVASAKEMPDSLPLETGMATLFETLKGQS